MTDNLKWWAAFLLALLTLGCAALLAPRVKCRLRLSDCSPPPPGRSSFPHMDGIIGPRGMSSTTASTSSPGATRGTASNSSTAEVIADDQVKNFYQHTHETRYRGQVWIHIIPHPTNKGRPHRIHIMWGPVEYENTFKVDHALTLLHEKTKWGRVPLDVHIEPAAYVEFGTGAPPGEHNSIRIDEGWTQR